MPPVLKRPAFYVWIAPPGTDPDTAEADDLVCEHVTIHHADQLRAELEAGRLRLPKGGRDAPMHLTSLWLWAALARSGRFTGNHREFQTACVAFEPDTDREEPHDDPDAEADDLDAHPTAASTG